MLYEHFTEEDKADIERRTELFHVVAQEFTCDKGKVSTTIYNQFELTMICLFITLQVESRKERNARGLDEINLTYGEIEFKSFLQVFRWI